MLAFSACSPYTVCMQFSCWAPSAQKVSLLLFKNFHDVLDNMLVAVIAMERSDGGWWCSADIDCGKASYYKFRIHHGAEVDDVCDIWAKCAGPDSIASEIIDINASPLCLPAGSAERYDGTAESYVNPWQGRGYTQAIIYEMHIRDWSRVEDPRSTGKFLDIAEGRRVIPYLKELGITHVQLLPCFDYAETNDDLSYNWGYNPYNYNVPEGRYVRKMKDGSDAVREFRALVQAFHAAGIAVNMDVVYNHTNGTERFSLYDMTEPRYFYRMKEDGSYANGSGCGNELASGRDMVRRFMLDSLRHWMLDYHINGFRFDLMGCHEVSVMRDIYAALSAIDSCVMVYGEPWTGGESLVADGVCKERIDRCAPNAKADGVACFNDRFRDAVKGAEFMCFNPGQVQGAFDDAAICAGLCGSKEVSRHLGRMINYAECHDNYTLFDKLAMCALGVKSFNGNLFAALDEEALALVKKEDTLAAAFVLLAQGTPFLSGGQEFLRTKRGDGNSYASCDDVNQIDFSFTDTYRDVLAVYKGLIALRKAYPETFGSNDKADATIVSNGFIRYRTGDFVVYFNATNESCGFEEKNFPLRVDVSQGKVEVGENTLPAVAAKSFLILKKAV